MPEYIQYNTALPAAECMRRLNITRYDDENQIKIYSNRLAFVLSYHRWGTGNAYQRRFYGQITRTVEGAMISGQFKYMPFTIVWMSLWFGMVGLIEVITIVSAISYFFAGRPQFESSPVLAVIAPLAFGMMGYGLLRFGRWLGRENEAWMVTYLREIIPPAQTNSEIDL